MFRFEEISFLVYLIGVVVLLGLAYYFYFNDRKRVERIGDKNLVDRLMPLSSNSRKLTKTILFFSGLIFLIASGTNPQWGTKKEKIKAQSSDIFIAFDISQSMMAQDISPSRLERAKKFTEDLISSLKGDRIGLIYFAGDAYLQMPLSSDYAAAQLFLRSANPNLAGSQGTVMDQAIELALDAYEEDVAHQRALIIVSDGEDHDQNAIAAAKNGQDNGLVTFTIGVGTEDGAYVPFVNRGRSEYKMDADGNPVISRLNVANLQEIAKAGGGEFYLVNQGRDAINDLKSKLERIEKREVEQKSFSEYNSYFQYFLGIGFILLMLGWVIPNRKGKIIEV